MQKINLDGPEVLQCYWHDLWNERICFSEDKTGVVLWWHGEHFQSLRKENWFSLKTKLIQKNQWHAGILSSYILNDFYDSSWILQQDNAPIDISKQTSQWFSEKISCVLDRPVRCPDLNRVATLCKIIARKDYAGCRKFKKFQVLQV